VANTNGSRRRDSGVLSVATLGNLLTIIAAISAVGGGAIYVQKKMDTLAALEMRIGGLDSRLSDAELRAAIIKVVDEVRPTQSSSRVSDAELRAAIIKVVDEVRPTQSSSRISDAELRAAIIKVVDEVRPPVLLKQGSFAVHARETVFLATTLSLMVREPKDDECAINLNRLGRPDGMDIGQGKTKDLTNYGLPYGTLTLVSVALDSCTFEITQ
jgi:hypothetical protein